jgi:polyvinyl alcohol dehydrogenase (cytochrome)
MAELAHGPARALLPILLLTAATGNTPAEAVAADAAAPTGVTAAAVTAPQILVPEKNPCPTRAEPVAIGTAQWNGWGRDIENTRYQPEPAIRASDVGKLALKWAYGYQAGAQFGQPTVVDGRLFISGSAGRVYSLDAKTGCTYWTFDAGVGSAGSRSAAIIGELGQAKRAAIPKKLKRTLAHLDVIKAPSAVFFGDDSGAVYALDAQRGTLLWKTQVDTHPLAQIIGAPALFGDRLFVSVASTEEKMAANPGYSCCTFRGSVVALDVASGHMSWKTYTVLEEPVATRKSSSGVQEFGPAGAAVASAPTVDSQRNVLYVGTAGSTTSVEQSLTNAVAAFNMNDGKLRWVKQLARPSGSASSGFSASPVLRTLANGKQVLLAGQKSGVMYGLDPDRGGEVLWQTDVAGSGEAGPGAASSAPGGGIAWGTAADHRNVYVALSGLLSQPTNDSGSLTALDMKTGAMRWRAPAPLSPCAAGATDCSHAQAQAVTVMPGGAFSGSMDGHLRAYSTINGKILWDFNTAKSFLTQNGVAAAGGPLDHGGATIVGGTIYINSGNALLAFSVDGK